MQMVIDVAPDSVFFYHEFSTRIFLQSGKKCSSENCIPYGNLGCHPFTKISEKPRGKPGHNFLRPLLTCRWRHQHWHEINGLSGRSEKDKLLSLLVAHWMLEDKHDSSTRFGYTYCGQGLTIKTWTLVVKLYVKLRLPEFRPFVLINLFLIICTFLLSMLYLWNSPTSFPVSRDSGPF